MNAAQFLDYVIRPTLDALPEKYRQGFIGELLYETAAHESMGFTYVQQLDGGPAVSFYQIEPATIEDVLRFLSEPRNADERNAFNAIASRSVEDLVVNDDPAVQWVQTDMVLATLIARFKYWMASWFAARCAAC